MFSAAHQADPADALRALAGQLRSAGDEISPHVVEPSAVPVLGMFAAAGPAATQAPGEYASVVEAVREGYLLHYGNPRVVAGIDHDLALLAGDYLYALGLERLAGLGDMAAIRELSDLISLSAQLHAEDRAARDVETLWRASACVIAAGGDAAVERCKAALRAGEAGAGSALSDATHELAARIGLSAALANAASE